MQGATLSCSHFMWPMFTYAWKYSTKKQIEHILSAWNKTNNFNYTVIYGFVVSYFAGHYTDLNWTTCVLLLERGEREGEKNY